jgi:hypothetical protein
MDEDKHSAPIARRGLLKLLGLGTAGTAVGAVVASNRVFARQFVDACQSGKLPDMVYDPELQVMVDPTTRKPIFDDAAKIDVASGYPTVTAGCKDCPKKDDDGS